MRPKEQPTISHDEYRKLLTSRTPKNRATVPTVERKREPLSEPIEFYVPLDLITANKLDAMNPIARGRHRKAQRITVAWHWRAKMGAWLPMLPVSVTLTRIARRRMDRHDAINHAFKHLVDQVTECLGLTNDDTGEIEWRYAQMPMEGTQPGITVRIEAKDVSNGL